MTTETAAQTLQDVIAQARAVEQAALAEAARMAGRARAERALTITRAKVTEADARLAGLDPYQTPQLYRDAVIACARCLCNERVARNRVDAHW